MEPSFWKGKKVFLTGHTGFKGGWLSLWLSSMGSVVKGFSLPPDTTLSLFNAAKISSLMDSEFGDIRDLQNLSKSMKAFNPDILIHMAAQPLVRLSYKEPISTYSTNVMGTVNVLESAKHCQNLKAILSVTTDKCYDNKEWEWGYRENEPMGGHDPYSSSKACAELVTAAYRNSYFNGKDKANVATARAGNVVGGGDWSEDRLIPDFIRAVSIGEKVKIRNPRAIRPWQHVLEPLSGYLMLSERLYNDGEAYAEAWNFGPDDSQTINVEAIINDICAQWGEGAVYEIEEKNDLHEAKYLKLDCSKAKTRLNWQSKMNMNTTIKLIVDWHKTFEQSPDRTREITEHQIKQFLNIQ